MKGRAFGFMGVCEHIAGTISATSVIYSDKWQTSYYCVGSFSVGMAWIAYIQLHPTRRRKFKNDTFAIATEDCIREDTKDLLNENSDAPKLSLRQIVVRIWKIPSFIYMVLQGVFGGTPWDMMSFMLLLLDWRGFTREQVVTIQFTKGIGAMIGGWVGGTLGDYVYQRFGTIGRIGVAFCSIVGGIPFYGLFLYATNFYEALLWINIFHIWAVWTQPAAIRPICIDLTRNPSERAQIISMWIVLEKASGAIFGAPLVGFLTNTMIAESEIQETGVPGASVEKTQALAFNLFVLSSLFWGIASLFWALMGYRMSNTPTNNFTLRDHTTEKSISSSNIIHNNETIELMSTTT